MDHNFENWIFSQGLSFESRRLLNEAKRSYQIEAYSASLLFSYLMFVNIVRERITSASCPNGLTIPHWGKIQKDVNGPDIWDKAVFEALIQLNPAPIFLLNEDIRLQIRFWKDRRNDCAHAKDTHIEASHVRTFLFFLRSNLSKIVVNGSRDALIEKIKIHFDPSRTKPGSSPDNLVLEIGNAVTSIELPDFFKSLFTEIKSEDQIDNLVKGTGYYNFYIFSNRVLEIAPQNIKDLCAQFIRAKEKRVINFLRFYPAHVNILNGHPTLLRKIWHDDLFSGINNDVPLLVSLLTSGLISASDYLEVFEQVFSRAKTFRSESHEDSVLQSVGYYNFIKGKITGDLFSNFDSANSKSALIIKYLENNVIDEDVARSIYEGFRHSNFAWTVAKSLNNLFRENSTKRSEYLTHVSPTTGIEIPEQIESLK